MLIDDAVDMMRKDGDADVVEDGGLEKLRRSCDEAATKWRGSCLLRPRRMKRGRLQGLSGVATGCEGGAESQNSDAYQGDTSEDSLNFNFERSI